MSAARAIRQPSRVETDLSSAVGSIPLPGGLQGILTVTGNPQIKPEELREYEIGYRAQVGKYLSLDIATFYSQYRRIETLEPGASIPNANAAGPFVLLPLIFDNKQHANDYGIEMFANWSVSSRWKLSPGFSTLRMNLELDPSSRDTITERINGDSPARRFQIRSSLKLPHNLDWDSSLYFVAATPEGDIPRHTRVDTRLGWRLAESVEISLVGQNLLRPLRYESQDAFQVHSTQVRRSAYAQILWRF